MSTEPAVFGTQVTRTMHAAFYGEFIPHQRPQAAGEVSQDAYSLFYARSAAMGWLTPAAEDHPGGLWGMNDAEASRGPGPPPSRVAFFQVSLTGSPRGTVLPVQQFLACAGDVIAHLGMLRLEAIQVRLPERDAPAEGRLASPSGMSAAACLLDALNWFADRDPRSRVRVRVTLDGGPDPSIGPAAAGIMEWVQDINQDVFVCDSFSLADDDHLIRGSVTADEGQPGADHHRVTLAGTLAEWSLDALGWLAAFLADGNSRLGVHAPLVFTSGRSAGPGRITGS